MADLFPLRARACEQDLPGEPRILPWDGADADVDNPSTHVPGPDLTVTDREPVGILYSPDGQSCRAVYDREQITFGFQPHGPDGHAPGRR